MQTLTQLTDLFIHLDRYIDLVIQVFGAWTYLILFLIIFCETGLVVTPFLPGDSLLFVAGAIASGGSLNVQLLFIIFTAAAILGNTSNYYIGRFIGPRIFKENARILKKEYLDKTHSFYEKYGGKTIIIARFLPVVRTVAPFAAGAAKMPLWRYTLYNAIGGTSWTIAFVFGGFFFGNLPAVQHNFTLVVLGIIFVSFLPTILEFIRQHLKRQ